MIANIITAIRIVCSIALLFFPGFSPAFLLVSERIRADKSDSIDNAKLLFVGIKMIPASRYSRDRSEQ